MKMSDVFNLPVISDDQGINDGGAIRIGIIYTERMEMRAVHAINMHDELVEALKETVEVIKNLNEAEGGLRPTEVYALSVAKTALNKERGLDK